MIGKVGAQIAAVTPISVYEGSIPLERTKYGDNRFGIEELGRPFGGYPTYGYTSTLQRFSP